MKKIIYFLIAIAFIFMTTKSYAAGNSNFSGLYVGGNIGLVDTNMGGANAAMVSETPYSSSGLSSAKTAFAFGLNAGYNYKLNRIPIILGAGIIYLNNSKITANGTLSYQGVSYPESISYSSYSYGGYLEPGVIISKRFLLYGRIGIVKNSLNNTSVQVNGSTENLSFSNGGSIYYGLGAQYLILKNVALNFEFDQVSQSISYSGSATGTPNTTMHNYDFLVGVSYYFGNM
jgi:opacity protein-like surface antigen